MLFCQNLYLSAEEGLDQADEKLIHIYSNMDLRIIIEALLLDETTPEQVYTDLFGLTQSEQEQYRKYFFNVPPGTPRLEVYEFVNTIHDQLQDKFSTQRRTLYTEVFNNGWEFIDYKFNKGRCIDVHEYGKTVFKEMMIALKDEARTGITTKDLTKMKTVLALMKSGTQLYADKKKEEKNARYTQMTLQFVEDIQSSVQMQDAGNYVKMMGAEVGRFGTVNSSIDAELERAIKEDSEAVKDKK